MTEETPNLSIHPDVIEEVVYHFQMYVRGGGSLTNQAFHLIELGNAVGDLSTYHPTYDPNNGTMWWDRTED